MSLFPPGLSNDALGEYLFRKLNSKRKFTGGFDYRERSIQSAPLPGVSMYKFLMAIDAEGMEEQLVSTLFTKNSIQAFNQVSHDIFIDVNL